MNILPLTTHLIQCKIFADTERNISGQTNKSVKKGNLCAGITIFIDAEAHPPSLLRELTAGYDWECLGWCGQA